MHEETFGGVVIYTVKTFGVMEICERQGYRKWHLPKYVVFRNDKALEEFRTQRAAFKWAKSNQNG
jgi:hypothetical protein